jgi:phosphopantetheinyl transferase (holo-ACP synthase)
MSWNLPLCNIRQGSSGRISPHIVFHSAPAPYLAGILAANEVASKAFPTVRFPFAELEVHQAKNDMSEIMPKRWKDSKKLAVRISITRGKGLAAITAC